MLQVSYRSCKIISVGPFCRVYWPCCSNHRSSRHTKVIMTQSSTARPCPFESGWRLSGSGSWHDRSGGRIRWNVDRSLYPATHWAHGSDQLQARVPGFELVSRDFDLTPFIPGVEAGRIRSERIRIERLFHWHESNEKPTSTQERNLK